MDPHFKRFIAAVSEHVVGKIGAAKVTPVESNRNPDVRLLFVRRPLLKSGSTPAITLSSLDDPRPDGARYLDSPWVRLTISEAPRCAIRAVFIWNERQFLLDQALMSGAVARPGHDLTPVTGRNFAQLAQVYADAVILAPPDGSGTQASALERIPPDVLWLFRQSWQSTRGPFAGFAMSALSTAIELGSVGYTDLILALADQFMASPRDEEHYGSVSDLKAVINLQKYRIDRLN
jgi:hypothetical protein